MDMTNALDPITNAERLAALRRLVLLDTPAEAAFDRLTTLATRVLGVPVALVTLVDLDRQFFKSCLGLPEPWATARETPLSHSFCQHAVAAREPFVVEDARAHPLVRANLAIRDLGVIAYLGIPLITADGHALGSFCAIDGRPRVWTPDDIATLTDLAALVMTEIELRTLVQQRNHQLVSEQQAAQRSREEAERLAALDRLRADFLATISHDLYTPLTAARTALRLVAVSAADRLQADELALLDNGRRNTEHLGQLLDDLLAINQLASGTLRLAREPLDLRAVAGDAVTTVEPLIRDKGQILAVDLPDPLPVAGDPRRLAQALVNLLANAHRHTPPGTRIAIAGLVAGDEVDIAVRDDGPGIAPAEHEAIFRRFHRLQPAAGVGGDGQGLGLAIARGIVELHGGRIVVESEPGRGATFRVRLPRWRDGAR